MPLHRIVGESMQVAAVCLLLLADLEKRQVAVHHTAVPLQQDFTDSSLLHLLLTLFTPLASKIAVYRTGHKKSEGSFVLGSTHGPHQLASVGVDFNREQLKTEPGPYIFEKHHITCW